MKNTTNPTAEANIANIPVTPLNTNPEVEQAAHHRKSHMPSNINKIITALHALGKESHHTVIAQKVKELFPDTNKAFKPYIPLHIHSTKARNPVVRCIGNGRFTLIGNGFKQPNPPLAAKQKGHPSELLAIPGNLRQLVLNTYKANPRVLTVSDIIRELQPQLNRRCSNQQIKSGIHTRIAQLREDNAIVQVEKGKHIHGDHWQNPSKAAPEPEIKEVLELTDASELGLIAQECNPEPAQAKEGIIQTENYNYIEIIDFPSLEKLQHIVKVKNKANNTRHTIPRTLTLRDIAKFPKELSEEQLNLELDDVAWKNHQGNCPDHLYLVLDKDYKLLKREIPATTEYFRTLITRLENKCISNTKRRDLIKQAKKKYATTQNLTITIGYSGNGVCKMSGYSPITTQEGKEWLEAPKPCREWAEENPESTARIALLSGTASSDGFVRTSGLRSKLEVDFTQNVLFSLDFWLVLNPVLFNVRKFPIHGLRMALDHVDELITFINPIAPYIKYMINALTREKMLNGEGVSQCKSNKAPIFVAYANPRIMGANYRRMTVADRDALFSEFEGQSSTDYEKFAHEDQRVVRNFLQRWINKRAKPLVRQFFGNRY